MTGSLEGQLRAQHRAVAGYYRVHAKIYDLTRWSFLRGRERLMRRVAARFSPRRILEVGCGTGSNLLFLGRRFSHAQLWGVDLSENMLAIAARKLKGLGPRLSLVQAAYDGSLTAGEFDLVVFSYALSMFNPGWKQALAAAAGDLAPGGAIAVVDFHHSAVALFRRWMGLNRVRLDGHLLPGLQSRFVTGDHFITPVYRGLWSYFLFIGQKP